MGKNGIILVVIPTTQELGDSGGTKLAVYNIKQYGLRERLRGEDSFGQTFSCNSTCEVNSSENLCLIVLSCSLVER